MYTVKEKKKAQLLFIFNTSQFYNILNSIMKLLKTLPEKVFHQYEPTGAVLAWSFPQTPFHIQHRHEPVAHGCASAFS